MLHAKTEETKEYISKSLSTRNIRTDDVSPDIEIDDLRCYSLNDKSHFYTDKSVFAYKGDEIPNFVRFDNSDDPPFTYACGTDGAKGIKGLLYTGRGACLIYPIAERLRELTLEIDLAVEKSGGEGFGSANGQYLELFVNYNHETQSGTALRLERESSAGQGVFMSVRAYDNGTNTIVSEKLFTQLYKTYCRLSVKYTDNQLEFKLSHNGAVDSLKTVCNECMSAFMVRSGGTTGVGNRFLILGLHAAFHSFQNSRKD